MKKSVIFVIFLAIAASVSQAQTYPRNYFTSPLDTPLIVTGTFGEIRDNHFHTGIDLSTDDQEGLPVSCVGEGYISRVKVSADGYGKALYVTHPNGFVSVYGHLEKFAGPIYEYVRRYQYTNQTFELDLQPKFNEFMVKNREVIAYSGQSGSAEGPHLHFEIRDEKTEDPINPLLFGFPVKDSIKPLISWIRIYPRRMNGIVNRTDSAETYDVLTDSDGTAHVNWDQFPQALGNIGFGIGATDMVDSSDATLGIYSAELFVDNNPVFTWRYDRLSFSNLKDVNAHIDYAKRTRDYLTIERFFTLEGDGLNIYTEDSVMKGYVMFDEDRSHDIRMIVKDFKGNKSELNFQVITYNSLSDYPYQALEPGSTMVSYDKGIAVHKTEHDVVIPEGSVYDNYYYTDEVQSNSIYESSVIHIGDPYVPLRKQITVGVKPKKEIPDSLKSKAVLIRIGEYNVITPCGGQWNGKFLTTKTNYFGSYAVTIDTVPPKAEIYYVPAIMDNMFGGKVMIKVEDNISGLKNYSGTIDGKWFLFEYDKKNKMLVAQVDALTNNTEHPMEITLTDERGNTTVWKSSFYF